MSLNHQSCSSKGRIAWSRFIEKAFVRLRQVIVRDESCARCRQITNRYLIDEAVTLRKYCTLHN